MADPLTINVTQAAIAAPAVYTVPASVEVEPLSAFAHYDGTAAAAAFLPALTFYSASGLILARVFPNTQVAVGGVADVTFAPFLGDALGGSGSSSPVVASGTFDPVGDLVEVTSTSSAAPTTLVTASSFEADGVTTYRIDVAIAAVDVSVTHSGTGAAFIAVLLRNSTQLGGIADYNVNPVNGTYGSIPLFASVLDTPPIGPTVYTVGAYKNIGGGATANIFAYGNNLDPPPAGGTHPGYVAVYEVSS